MSLAEHVWGESPGADRVWAQVAGMAPSLIGKRLFLVFQAFFDESQGEDGTYVLAGHVATVANWAAFSREWEQMLPRAMPRPPQQPQENAIFRFRPTDERPGALGTTNAERYHFKAREMAQTPDRMERMRGFYRLITKYVTLSLSARVHIAELRRAMARVHIAGVKDITWNGADTPHSFAFYTLMDNFSAYRRHLTQFVPAESRVDLYFDETSHKALIRKTWDHFFGSMAPELRNAFGSEPRFESDHEFMPLQAADLWAYWTMTWHAEGAPQKMENAEFPGWNGGNTHPKIDMIVNEDGAVRIMKNIVRQTEPGVQVYDIKSSFSPWVAGQR